MPRARFGGGAPCPPAGAPAGAAAMVQNFSGDLRFQGNLYLENTMNNSSIGGTRVAAFMQGFIEDHSNSTKRTKALLPSCNGTSEGCSNRAKGTTGLPLSYNGALNGCRNPTMSNTGLLHWYN